MRDLRVLHALRPFIWVVSHALPSFRDYMGGFVWVENGRVVGNTTVSRSSSGSHWIISNVAVLPEYRRRGIARAMVEAAIDYADAHHGTRIMLQVRSDNLAAIRLYEVLGFRYVESLTEMVAEQVRPTRLDAPAGVTTREPVPERWYEAYEVARVAIPARVQQLRPLRLQQYRIGTKSTLQQVREWLFPPARERWWVEQDGKLLGLLTIDRQAQRGREQVEILIAPEGVQRVEAALVNRLSERLRGRDVRISVASGLSLTRVLLKHAGFQEVRTLDHMVREL
jgi:GNAT superfamily N-acetyltransferase